ncbi:hypothetical protein IC762_31325 [Bradyrhizobium genosp. L]|uniref:hypothetical protein n=1 Tax=Bradyrhizobium genosp. L TaxID=83637 RepID=UPI0018A2BA40|nr:hypothetical protein [Bradyrhizobium genosp. L]QPF84074.1 hypothetical protein IC762_31325 [Bradyrhizobium genosp. L]
MLVYRADRPNLAMTFSPRIFYRSEDYSVSSNRPEPGLVADQLLYAADGVGMTLHLFPRIDRISVVLDCDAMARLSQCGVEVDAAKQAVVFMAHHDLRQVQRFRPTVYAFDAHSFVRVASGEFVSRSAVTAVGVEHYCMRQALREWQTQLRGVSDLTECETRLKNVGIRYATQKFGADAAVSPRGQ